MLNTAEEHLLNFHKTQVPTLLKINLQLERLKNYAIENDEKNFYKLKAEVLKTLKNTNIFVYEKLSENIDKCLMKKESCSFPMNSSFEIKDLALLVDAQT